MAVATGSRTAAKIDVYKPDVPGPSGSPVPKALADELTCVAAWIDKEAHRIEVIHADVGLASAYPALPRFEASAGAPR